LAHHSLSTSIVLKVLQQTFRVDPMITESSRQGLIVSAGALATPALKEVIDCCGWPVLLQATPRQLRREMLLGVPKLSLFWLDDDRYVGTTVQLLSWLGMCEPTVRRITVGYRLPANVEVAVRCAGTHLYLAADGNLRSLLESAVATWLQRGKAAAIAAGEPTFIVQSVGCSQAPLGITLHPSGPP
jgi:hypothetical protein